MVTVFLLFQFSMYKALVLALVCFGASILTFYSGFGLGTILLVVFALWFPIEQAIVMTAIVHFVNNLFKLFLTHKNIDKKILLKFGLPSILGALGGAFLLTRMTGDQGLKLDYELVATDASARQNLISSSSKTIPAASWDQKALEPLNIKMPDVPGLATLRLTLKNNQGQVLHRNFVNYVIESKNNPTHKRIISTKPGDFKTQQWSLKQWDVLNGLKENGAGAGFFEYDITIPSDLMTDQIKSSYLVMELSSKPLLDKDRGEEFNNNQDYMLGSKVSPSKNPNAYPMTDDDLHPSTIAIYLNGKKVVTTTLADDPADHLGVLSWHAQLQDKKLREAGTYGYLVKVPLDKTTLADSKIQGHLHLKLESTDGGGLAVYGAQFGRYPIDINLVVEE